MADRITFKAGNLTLEGLLTRGDVARAVVVAHPHPLYGGDMENPVVETVADAFASGGYTVLRFNFRGVGRSEGTYGDGEGECDDMAAAVAYLAAGGAETVHVAGYSFGAWVAALHHGRRAADPVPGKGAGDGALFLVSPPVGFLDFSGVGELPGLKMTVTGTLDDQIAPGAMIRRMMPSWNASADYEEIAGGDHFYSGTLAHLKEIITAYMD